MDFTLLIIKRLMQTFRWLKLRTKYMNYCNWKCTCAEGALKQATY